MSAILSSFVGGKNFNTPRQDQQQSVKQIQWIFPSGKSFVLPERPAAVNLNDHASKSTGIFPGVSSSFPISRLFDNHCEQQLLWITPEQFPRVLLLQTFLKRFYAFKIGAPSLNFRLAEWIGELNELSLVVFLKK